MSRKIARRVTIAYTKLRSGSLPKIACPLRETSGHLAATQAKWKSFWLLLPGFPRAKAANLRAISFSLPQSLKAGTWESAFRKTVSIVPNAGWAFSWQEGTRRNGLSRELKERTIAVCLGGRVPGSFNRLLRFAPSNPQTSGLVTFVTTRRR